MGGIDLEAVFTELAYFKLDFKIDVFIRGNQILVKILAGGGGRVKTLSLRLMEF